MTEDYLRQMDIELIMAIHQTQFNFEDVILKPNIRLISSVCI